MTAVPVSNEVPTKLTTPVGILSFPHLFTPQAAQQADQKDKFSCTIVFLKGTDLAALVAAAYAAAEKKWPGKGVELLRSGKIKSPFRTDATEKGYEEGAVFINVRSEVKPQIVSRFKDSVTNKAIPITDEAEMYPGCLVRATIAAFGYDKKGNRGVSFGLNNIQKMGEGARLDGRKAAVDEFDADLTQEPADLSSLGIPGA
jgi:hypothetical protein